MRGKIVAKNLRGVTASLVLEDAVTAAVQRKILGRLLEGLLTAGERETLAQRLFVGRLLAAGWSYRKIRAWTGASPNTVAAVDRWLKQENPRYRRLLTLRHRRDAKPQRQGFSDTFRPLPGSIKNLYQSLTGTSLW